MNDSALPLLVWQDLVATLMRRRKLIAAVFASGVTSAAVLVALQAPTYRATAKLMATAERTQIVVSPAADSKPTVDRVTVEYLSSEVALLRSPALVREALEPYRERFNARRNEPAPLAQRLVAALNSVILLPTKIYRGIHGVPVGDPFERWVLGVAKDVTITPLGKSSVIEISYAGREPEWTAKLVNELASRHVERRARLNQTLDARRFLEAQRELLATKQRQAEEALGAFYEREGITDSVPDQQAVLHTRLKDWETALVNADTELAENTARADFLANLVKQPRAAIGGAAATTRLAQADPRQLVKSRIAELALQRSELLSKFAPTSIKVQDLDRQIAEAQRLLGADSTTERGLPADLGTADQGLETELAQARTQMAAVKARKDALRAHIAEARAKLDHLDQIASEHERLDKEVAAAKETFLTYVRKEEEARFSNALDESRIVNVTVAEPAQVPIAPEPSKGPVVLALAAALSLIAGFVMALLRDRLDPAVKSAAEARRITGLPLLADIPG
ncbi:MAG: hypothetical protein HY699_13165 [Deltaproteobacteria bacterium]|nr:hypothetical protein [Deltaproteobacteria bacterium]